MKVSVICANFGDYDDIHSNPELINKDSFDWFMFTDNKDNKDNKSDFWNIINEPYYNQNKIDGKNNFMNDDISSKVKNMMIAKYYKLQAHNVDFIIENNYTHIVWIDSSVSILNNNFVNDLSSIISQDKNELVNFIHPERDNIYDEGNLSIRMDKYDGQDISLQLKKYQEEGFGYKNKGLYWCGFFCRKVNDRMNKIFDDWWEENIKMSFQDQISFPYVLWKNNKSPDCIIYQSMYQNEFLGRVNYPHKAHKK